MKHRWSAYYGCSLGFHGNQHWPNYESFVSWQLNNFSASKATERCTFACITCIFGNLGSIWLAADCPRGPYVSAGEHCRSRRGAFPPLLQCCIIVIIPFYSALSASFSWSKSAQMGLTLTTSSPALRFLAWPKSSASPMSHLEHFCPCLHH